MCVMKKAENQPESFLDSKLANSFSLSSHSSKSALQWTLASPALTV